MLKCQALDRNDRLQRATTLVNTMSRHCDDDSFSAFRESLIEVGQKRVVDKYFRRRNAANLHAPGRPIVSTIFNRHQYFYTVCLETKCLSC